MDHRSHDPTLALKSVEKLTTAVGDAYFDDTPPVYIGRVGTHEVQIEPTIQPCLATR